MRVLFLLLMTFALNSWKRKRLKRFFIPHNPDNQFLLDGVPNENVNENNDIQAIS